MKKQKTKITKNMTFSEILEKNPDAIEVLFKNGMHCIGCAMSANETLEEGSLAHGIDPDSILRAFGSGPLAPVASNETEEGRGKNRRVELEEQP